MFGDKLEKCLDAFGKKNPEIVAQICEMSLKVCLIEDLEVAIRSDVFNQVCNLVTEHHEALCLPVDVGETDILRWITSGVFKKILTYERQRN